MKNYLIKIILAILTITISYSSVFGNIRSDEIQQRADELDKRATEIGNTYDSMSAEEQKKAEAEIQDISDEATALDEEQKAMLKDEQNQKNNKNQSGGGIKIIVTERIPGANCSVKDKDKDGVPLNYECSVSKGFSAVTIMLGKMIKYFTYIAALSGVLYIVINGIIYSMGGADQGMKDESKKRITSTLIGLVLLFISGVILNLIAPWIYK